MKPYFDKERIEVLKDELERWRFTSFRYNCQGHASPGIVADCVSFPLNVFKDLELIPHDYKTPTYISVRSPYNELQKIFAGMDTLSGLVKVWDVETDCPLIQTGMIAGDIIVCSSGRAIQHLMIYVDGVCWHCWPGDGVQKIPFTTSQIHKTAKRVYRWHE